MVSVPSSMIASRLLAPIGVGKGGAQGVDLMWAWNGPLFG
jgi:hypothetical protein